MRRIPFRSLEEHRQWIDRENALYALGEHYAGRWRLTEDQRLRCLDKLDPPPAEEQERAA